MKTVPPTLQTGMKRKVVEAVDEAKDCLQIKEVIGQTQTDRKGLGSSTAKWWSKAEGKEKRNMVINEIRLVSMKISEGFRKQSSNHIRDNGLTGIIPYRNPSHGMRSSTWRHFKLAFSSDQCTISCPQAQPWYGGERKRTPLVRYAKAGRLQSMS